MARPNHRVTTVVRSIRRESARVLSYELADPDDWRLPPFTPGAHVDVHLPNGMIRQYSLCGDPAIGNRYVIAVQKDDAGRGGSVFMHDAVRVGDILPVSLPRNHFSFAGPAAPSVFIAGGIGITPVLAMIEAVDRAGAPGVLHYAVRDRRDLPFRKFLEALEETGRARIYAASAKQRLAIDLLFENAPASTHFYCCGPERMVADFRQAAARWPAGQLHVESFGAHGPAAAVAYNIELVRSRRSIQVAASETMLAALRRSGVELDASCEAGVCLQCKTRYLEGDVEHRDLLLTAEDRRTHLTPCVSHGMSRTVVLDL